ncbi:U1 small nuclear ribonucleoprotein 70 kDa [Cucumis melo var. makuwa]|uniref:U1 small nuclear ribonucleoprotein 70 kDa n=1 Tax=Cucumis melo var. makuwa TaxID=1194695 RepID=A0A5D3CMG9_CUCMM|nr:U1 small nuclear ribonucleoprotein 70 kDa [Cucumis melo var. makuwa]TYK12630.1 U1 small nuclear ribonucleoprotein 70 kDa [Cucumis melo var. makuwa]
MGDYNDAFMRNQNAAVQARTKAQNRANVLQLKLIGQSHPTGLTANLLKLFEPRPPLEFKPPPEKRKCPPLTGMAQFVSNFAEPDDPEYAPPVQKGETPAERRARIHLLRIEKGAEKAAEELPKYLERDDPNVTGDPYKTLFVARLNYETTESRIKREFESYGPIKRVRLITDKVTGKPKGYAFIEYMHKRDMKAAYKQADGRKIDGRRVLVDVERGRTVPNWRPRRLGGGLGTTRVGGEENSQRHSGREQQQSGAPSRSEEPRAREDRHGERDREKSYDKGRDREREREKSREHSHERSKERDVREDRHHRDHPDRGRSHDRDDYDRVESKYEKDRHGDRDRDRDMDRAETEDGRGWYDQPEHGHRDADHDPQYYDHFEHNRGRGQYDQPEGHRDQDRYDQYDDRMDDDYHYERGNSESHDRERSRDLNHEYKRSERSHSREY